MLVKLRARAFRSFARFSAVKFLLVCITAILPITCNFLQAFGLRESIHMFGSGPIQRLCAAYWFIPVLQYIALWTIWHFCIRATLIGGRRPLSTFIGLSLTFLLWGLSNVLGSAAATETFSKFSLNWNEYSSLVEHLYMFGFNPFRGPIVISHATQHLNLAHVGIQHSIFLAVDVLILLV